MRKVLSCVARLNGALRAQAHRALPGRLRRARGGRRRAASRVDLRGLARAADRRGCSTSSARSKRPGSIMAEGDEYPCLRITAAGREVMLDRARMQAALPAERAASPRPSACARRRAAAAAAAAATVGGGDDEPVDEPLFARLRELRARAGRGGVAAGVLRVPRSHAGGAGAAAAGDARRDGGGSGRRSVEAGEVWRGVPRCAARARRIAERRSSRWRRGHRSLGDAGRGCRARPGRRRPWRDAMSVPAVPGA